ncbi:MAG: flagellar export chaperone FliS [Cellvibrionaceae bacterium]
MSNSGVDAYRKIDVKARVESASPGQLIVLLFEGLLRSLVETRTAIIEGDLKAKGEKLSSAMSIVLTLRESLDDSVDSDLPHNIDRLYDYIQRKMIEINQTMDIDSVDEVMELVITLKSGWDKIVESA